jgi:hypothetical protein
VYTWSRSRVKKSKSGLTVVAEALPLSSSLVTELDVADLDSSLAFYVGLIGFPVV